MATAKVQVNARLDPDLYDAAKTHMYASGQTMSDTIADALRMFLSKSKRAAERKGQGW